MSDRSFDAASGTWEFFDHAADVGIRIQANSLESLFIAAGRALMDWMGSAPGSLPSRREKIWLEAECVEDLLVCWLQELLYHFNQRHAYFLAGEDIVITPTSLQVVVVHSLWGEEDSCKYQEIKAVTYHQLHVDLDGSICRASVILDI